MSEGPPEYAAAFITPGLCGPSTELPPLVRLVLIAPAVPALTFQVNFVIAAAFAHMPAKRVKAFARIRIADFAISHCG
jgi:hypothetical protein